MPWRAFHARADAGEGEARVIRKAVDPERITARRVISMDRLPFNYALNQCGQCFEASEFNLSRGLMTPAAWRPLRLVSPASPPSGSAVVKSHVLTCDGVASGQRSMRRAATPETNAADTDVPDCDL